jgi:uncharacterized protein YigE (DUF2233 family)
VPTGLVVGQGQTVGASYGAFAGMFAVTPAGPSLRWLEQQPLQPGEALQAGLQSFPLLIKPGGILGFPAQHDDGQQARRTIVGQDRRGRIIFLVTGHQFFTLHRLSMYLVESDLDLDIALNLDGGTSSGLLLRRAAPSFSEGFAGPALLPVVITVIPR